MLTSVLRPLLYPLLAGCAMLLVLSGCSGSSTTEPRIDTLVVAYAEPASFPPPPFADPSCAHHNAPSFLRVETDWGASGSLQPREGTEHSLAFDLPAAGDHWLRVSDYRFCSTGCPLATTGISVNGVPLVRLESPDSLACPAVWFRVSSDGTVSP